MQIQQLNLTKLEDYGPGPWIDEPDKANWKDPITNLDCMIVRNQMGNLCGYVGIPLNSKIIELDYKDLDINIHGGLTYAATCHGIICHEAKEEVFWYGFDCAHAGDYSPINYKWSKDRTDGLFDRMSYETYKDFEYVKNEVECLAKQIKELL